MNPHVEKLWRMLEEGKISPEQYEALRANLPGEETDEPQGPATCPPPLPSPSSGKSAKSTRPDTPLNGLVLACAVFLFIAAGLQLVALLGRSINAEKSAPIFFSILLNIGFGIGLLKMKRWMYLVELVNVLTTVLFNFLSGQAPGFVFNSIFLGMMLAAWPAFYPGRTKAEVWRDLMGRLRQAKLREKSRRLPASVRALDILLFISALLCLTGPLIIHYIIRPISLGTSYTSQPLALHIKILWFISYHYRELTPLQGFIAAAITFGLRYGIRRLNRIVFLILGAFTVLGIIGSLIKVDPMAILLFTIQGTLMIASWHAFFAIKEGEENSLARFPAWFR